MRFVDFEVAFDGAPVLDRETLTIAVLPWTGDQPSHDDLYLCEDCVKKACELLGAKPELSQRQLREIRRLELTVEHLKDKCRRLQDALGSELDAVLGERSEPRARSRRPKVAA
jgi:hypothetical protein